jgi:hypothetical protein
MAHWAEINKQKKVIRVVVGDNNDPNGDEGYQWLLDNLGGTWVKTSYNSKIRYNYASVGYSYDPDSDAFIAPKPTCGHKELFLNDLFVWNCQRCELDTKALFNGLS